MWSVTFNHICLNSIKIEDFEDVRKYFTGQSFAQAIFQVSDIT